MGKAFRSVAVQPGRTVILTAYGLIWEVPEVLPTAWAPAPDPCDLDHLQPPGSTITVDIEPTPTVPTTGTVRVSVAQHASEDSRWWQLPHVGTVWTDGTKVRVEPSADVDWALVALLLTGPVAAEVLWRNGALPVLGSGAATRHGRSVLLFGSPAVGVSTLARTLVRRGGSWLGDGLLAVYPPTVGSTRSQIAGGSARVLLARDSCARLGITSDQRTAVREGTTLLASDVPRWQARSPRPLDWLAHLSTSKEVEPIWVRRRGAGSSIAFLRAFAASCVGTQARNATGEGALQFQRMCAVANSLRRCDFIRPDSAEVAINSNARALEAALR